MIQGHSLLKAMKLLSGLRFASETRFPLEVEDRELALAGMVDP